MLEERLSPWLILSGRALLCKVEELVIGGLDIFANGEIGEKIKGY